MLFSFGIVKFNYVFLNRIVFYVTFYIALCKIKLCLLLQSRNSVPESCIRVFRIVLCFSVLNYRKVIYANVISYVALGVQNLDDWARVGNGSSVPKCRTRRVIVWLPEIIFAMETAAVRKKSL